MTYVFTYLAAALSPLTAIAAFANYYSVMIGNDSYGGGGGSLALAFVLLIAATGFHVVMMSVAFSLDGLAALAVMLLLIAGIGIAMLGLVLSILMLLSGWVAVPPFICVCLILAAMNAAGE
ncbi:hypothetical protein [Loktanella sp. M215]|uniref:hypothetical protein n=1 Tax=Loktanella sp. M215 TaxID=2675431 RepID=UPI001F32FB12|nr:hypothetical protein [Loktanella sp. M215]MCF7699945.1 hypothetical protein [Loktanella sp. M215]